MPFGDRIAQKVSQTQEKSHSSDVLTPDEVIATLAINGEPVPTGWAPLDRQLRGGGLPPGRLMVIGGPAFAGKTTIACQMAVHMAHRLPVYALFSDEGRSQAALRLGVQLGATLETMEGKPAEGAGLVREYLGERVINLFNPERFTAAAMVERIADSFPHQPSLVILDSAQTIDLDDDPSESPRMAVTKLAQACRKWCDKYQWTIILVSQVNRAFYRSKKDDDNSTAMTAFAEARLENFADVAIVLGLTEDETGIVHVRIPKNRLLVARPAPFDVRYDPHSGSMLELDQATLDAAAMDSRLNRLKPVKERLIEILKTQPGGLVSTELRELAGVSRNDVLEALRDLVKTGRVVFMGRKYSLMNP